MKRQERLIEIEKVWKSSYRSDYFDGTLEWQDIQWEPFAIKGKFHDGVEMCDPEDIRKRGHFMYIWGECEEASGWIEWDWAFIRCLYTWYMLPEDCNAPLFLNETAMAVCIPDVRWVHHLVHLFQHPDSVHLGMEHMEAEKAAQDAADKAKREAALLANPVSSAINRQKFMAFLNSVSEATK